MPHYAWADVLCESPEAMELWPVATWTEHVLTALGAMERLHLVSRLHLVCLSSAAKDPITKNSIERRPVEFMT